MVKFTVTIGFVSSILVLGQCKPHQAPHPAHPALVARASIPTTSTMTTSPVPLASGNNSTAIASATNAVKALSSAIAAYKQNPDKDHAQAAKDKADEAKQAVVIAGSISTGFVALGTALDALIPAAEAAVSNPGPDTATDLENKEKDVDDAEDEVEEEQSSSSEQQSHTSTAKTSSSSSSSSTEPWVTASPPNYDTYQTPMNSISASSLGMSIFESQEDSWACITTVAFPFPSSCPKPTCKEGNNSLMGVNNEPASWCFCGTAGPFATVASATTNYCDFTAMPHSTISLTSHSTSIDTRCTPTSTVTSASTQSYCQCGNVVAGINSATSTISSTTYKYGVCAMQPPQTFNTETETPTPTPTATPLCGNYAGSWGNDWTNQPLGFPRDTGYDAIQKYCGNQIGDKQTEPGSPDYMISLDTDGLGRERFWYNADGKYCGAQGGTGYWKRDADCPSVTSQFVMIWFQWSVNKTGCAAQGTWHMPKGDECTNILMPLLDSCDTGTPSDPKTWKHGGAFRLSTGAGCLDIGLFGLSQYSFTGSQKLPAGKPDKTEELTLP